MKLVIVGFVSVLIIIRLLCPVSDALLKAKGDTEEDSAPKSIVEKPPSTPEMSASKAEEMVDAMLQNSPLPEARRSDVRLLESSGSDKLPE